MRVLQNPDEVMRAAQFRVLTRILNTFDIPEYVYAFEKGRNIPRMAQVHTEKGLVISLDLQDFFGSIKQKQVKALFESMGFGEAPSITLSEICTYKAYVPQGALTSPKLSNMITATTFGPLVKEYCDSKGYALTIYADDITISCQQDLVKESGYPAAIDIIRDITEIVSRFGFRINRDKTKIMRQHRRQYVCGAVVNRKVNLQKTERNRFRAIVHNAEMQGIEAAAAVESLTPSQFVSKLMGQLNWFSQLNPEAGNRLKAKFKQVVQEQSTLNAVNICEENLATQDIQNTEAPQT